MFNDGKMRCKNNFIRRIYFEWSAHFNGCQQLSFTQFVCWHIHRPRRWPVVILSMYWWDLLLFQTDTAAQETKAYGSQFAVPSNKHRTAGDCTESPENRVKKVQTNAIKPPVPSVLQTGRKSCYRKGQFPKRERKNPKARELKIDQNENRNLCSFWGRP